MRLFIGQKEKESNLYWLHAQIMHKDFPLQGYSPKFTIMATSVNDTYQLWHKRFGHAGKKAITQLPGNVKGVPDKIDAPTQDIPCDGCEFGKSRREAFPPSDSRASQPLALVHMDLVEYLSLSIDGFKFAMTTLDDFSSFGLVWYLKRKSDAFDAFKRFVAWAETQSDRKLKAIRSNRGGNF